jgi:hypothetical protein
MPKKTKPVDIIERSAEHKARAAELVASVQASLEIVRPLREELRRCAMIYQYGEKLEAAQAWDKPFAYFDVEYRRWARYRSLLHRKREAAFKACTEAGYPAGVKCPADHPLYQELMGSSRQAGSFTARS